jgi:hypothetical protein
MTGKLQRNPSTLKLMRDSATGKLMRTAEYSSNNCSCFDAGKTPLYYTVTFSDVTLCPGKSWPGGININKTWKLHQYFSYPQCEGNCCYIYDDGNWQITLDLKKWNGLRYITLLSALWAPPYYFGNYSGADYYESCDINGIFQNYACNYANCLHSWYVTKGGIARICPDWYPGGCP